MNEPSIFDHFKNAQSALRATIQKILDLNRQLKSLTRAKEPPVETTSTTIKSEIKLLHKVAGQQAKILQLYEHRLGEKVSNG